MKHRSVWIGLLATACVFYGVSALSQSQTSPPKQAGAPAASPEITPAPFRSADGRISGWKVTIAGGRPLATPAIAEGKVFVGGGFGSHEFYAFDAETGKRVWTYHTADDGPTAAVVENGNIAFNTESCELEVITTNGTPLWKKWLGDPLMSMPAVSGGIVYMAYPDSRGDRKYYVAAFDLKTGRQLWKHPLADEIITAPVIDGERLYLATLNGTVHALNRQTGSQLWEENNNATSAPAVWKDRSYFSRRQEVKVPGKDKQQTELMAARSVTGGGVVDMVRTQQPADYLDYAKRAKSAGEKRSQALDALVGFAGLNKGSAAMFAAPANIGQASVHGIWAYQGSKAFIDHGKLYASMGDRTQGMDPDSGKVIWSRILSKGKDAAAADGVLTPPAIVNGKVFVANSSGDLYVLSAITGEVLWTVPLGEPIAFQPAVVGGRVFVATNQGSLFSLKTNDPRDDGWTMWGGSAAHNGPLGHW